MAAFLHADHGGATDKPFSRTTRVHALGPGTEQVPDLARAGLGMLSFSGGNTEVVRFPVLSWRKARPRGSPPGPCEPQPQARGLLAAYPPGPAYLFWFSGQQLGQGSSSPVT